ncbi:MAG TPA: YiiD C-terminal domain-containing protein [Gammaproteobacteria bacterium]|nr:YiiD C-terminal domain-containing protein [Gammaproteobacteria bacterium]
MNAAASLQQKIRASIPLSEAMQFTIESLDSEAIRVSAPLEPNINIHGTGFAGSIYSIAVLTGWALCTHILEDAGIDAELVVAKAEIRYRAPVTGELNCTAKVDAGARDLFLRATRGQSKGLLQLEIAVGDTPQAVLNATFCALRSA